MQYRRLGRSEIEVSTVALGGWPLAGGHNWGEQKRDDSVAAIHAALDAGVNFFDTAPGYGHGHGQSELLLGEMLADRGDEVIIATKIGPEDFDPERIGPALDGSLQRLRRDRIDLYQIHWPNWDVPIEDTMAQLEALRVQGKIGAIGVSNFGPRDLADVLNAGRIEAYQPAYNLLVRAIEYETQAMCAEHAVGILCYCPIAQGLLTGKFDSADDVPEERARTLHFSKTRPLTRHEEDGFEEQTFETIRQIRRICDQTDRPMAEVALAWCLHRPAVTSVLAGARNAKQVQQNVRAADLSLGDDVLGRLDDATDALKQLLGNNVDQWQPAGECVR